MIRWAPWRPVKLAVKLAVSLGTVAAAIAKMARWTRDPCEP